MTFAGPHFHRSPAFLGVLSWILAGVLGWQAFRAPCLAQERVPGFSVELDGKGSYVELPDRFGEDLQEATLEFRVRWDAFTYYGAPLHFGDTNSLIAFSQSEVRAAPKLSMQRGAGQPRAVFMDECLRPGVWLHLAGTWDRHAMRFWINGTCVGTNAPSEDGFAFLEAAPARWLGRSPWPQNGYFRGRIDELRVWRRALSEAEMEGLPEARMTGSEPGLVARWSMDRWDPDPGGAITWSDGERRLPARLRGGARAVEEPPAAPGHWPRPWFLSGSVRAASGLPIQADLEWWLEGRWVRRFGTSAEGTFLLRGLGEVTNTELRVTRGRQATVIPVRFGQPRRVHLDLTLREAVSIEGQTRRLDGQAIDGIRVRAVRIETAGVPASRPFETRSDQRGEFRFLALPPGEYDVSCAQGRDPLNPRILRADARRRVRVLEGANPVSVDFVLPPDGTRTGWRRLGRQEGIPESEVGPLAMDGQGRLWVGTLRGLMCLDGANVRTWSRGEELPSVAITALEFAADGTLWIGSLDGLATLGGTNFGRVSLGGDPRPVSVGDLARTADGSMWVGTDRGLYRYRDGTWDFHGVEQGLPAAAVSAVWPESESSVTLVTEGGLLARVAAGNIELLGPEPWSSREPGLPEPTGEKSPSTVRPAPVSIPWKGWGQFLVGNGRQVVDSHEVPLPIKANIRTILHVGDREAWVATGDGGLWHYGRSATVSLTPREGLPDAPVTTSLRSADGSLWIGTRAGLARWHEGLATVFGTSDGLPSDVIHSLHESGDGTLWVGTDAGLVSRRSDGFHVERNLLSSPIYRIWAAPSGNLRLWMTGIGLWVRQGDAWVPEQPDELQPFVWGWGLVPARAGGYWILARQGLLRLRDEPTARADPRVKPPIEAPSCVEETADGDVWVGTWSNGLYHRDRNGHWRNFRHEDDFASPRIRCLHADARGALWVGTSSGVILLRDGITSVIDSADGVAGSQIHHIRSESDGTLWFATDGGLTRYSPNLEPPQASWRDGEGITGASADGTVHAELGAPLRFAVQTAPRQRVRWRIGDDRDPGTWTSPRAASEHPWTPPSTGSYVIEAQVMDRDLNLSPTLRRRLEIRLPWHRRPTVMLPAALVSLGLVFFLVRSSIHLRRQRRESERLREEARALAAADRVRTEFERRLIRSQEAERDRIARELHDSLGQELLLIRNAALLARRDGPGADPSIALGDIAERASRSIGEVRAIAYALRPQELQRYGLVVAMRTLCEELSERYGVRIDFAFPTRIPAIHADVEMGLFRILQECLTNALKHARATVIEATLRGSDEGLDLRVADGGCGFDPDAPSLSPNGGLGLGGMRERVRLLQGRITIRSQPGQGTTVEVWVPLAPGLVSVSG